MSQHFESKEDYIRQQAEFWLEKMSDMLQKANLPLVMPDQIKLNPAVQKYSLPGYAASVDNILAIEANNFAPKKRPKRRL